MAEDWDSLREGYFSEAVRDKATALAEPAKGKVAMDLAGTGFLSEGLLRKGLLVVAVDEPPEMPARGTTELGAPGGN